MRVFTRFDEVASTEETNHFLKYLSTVVSLRIEDQLLQERVLGLLGRENWRGICELELDYGSLRASDVFNVSQVKAFFQKREDLDLGIDRAAMAASKFKSAEEACRETNHRLYLRNRGVFSLTPRVERVFYSAQRKIARILGDVPSLGELFHASALGLIQTLPKPALAREINLGLICRFLANSFLMLQTSWRKCQDGRVGAPTVISPEIIRCPLCR